MKPVKAAPRPTARAKLFALGHIACSSCGAGSPAMRLMTGYRQSAKSYARRRLHRIAVSPAVAKPKKSKSRFMNVANSTRVTPKMYETENDISQQRRSELTGLLNRRLADAIDLQLQLKQAHWNVKGPHFIGLHELFDKIAEDVETYVDEIAERAVQLGGITQGTVRAAAASSRLEEYPATIADGSAHVEAVAKALSTFGREARVSIDEANALDDADTADLFTEVSRGIDKWLWFVEAHSQASK
jgi:starvation-inducible DNA-binding protein